VAEVFRPISTFAPGFVRRIHDRIPAAAKLVFWPLAVLALMSLALQLGTWHTEFKIAGPFAAETSPPRASLILEIPQAQRDRWWRQPLVGDDGAHPFQSFLELRIDGRGMGPPHTLHETIRTGETTGFSHWGPHVIFSLPPGVKNGPETIATLRYVVRPKVWVTSALAIVSALLGCLIYFEALRSLRRRLAGQPRAFVLRIPYLILVGLCWVGLAASAVYIASSLYAWATGWALPTTALIRWSRSVQWAANNEPYFGYLLLMLAGVGTATTWLIGSTALYRPLVESNEQSLRRLLDWCRFPIAACAFVFCVSAMWAGIVRPGDFHYANLGGLVPFSDAEGYLVAAFDQVRDGVWSNIALRRPLAAGFRSVLLIFGNFSLSSMLILQACLVAGAACFATQAIVAWRGVWAGTAFFALTYIYARIFVPTPLTEPPGLFWALLSIPFFIKAFRDRSAGAALVAFAMTMAALMTRMGSMFTIPALLIWLVWQFGNGIAAKLRIALAATAILLGVLGLNSLLLKTYGTSQSSLGSNFSYVVCGLTIGTGWEGCPAKLANEGKALRGDDAAVASQLYSMAWGNFRAKPEIFFSRLTDNLEKFASDFPDVIWRGYLTGVDEPAWLFRNTLTAISLIGLVYIGARRARFVELSFWALLWASLAASSSLIYYDDGPRTLAASHPLIALFFAMGMSSPGSAPTASSPRSRLSQYGLVGLIAAALLFVCVPWVAHQFFAMGRWANATPLQKKGEAFVFGGRRMSGFLVVNEGMPLRKDVPSIHLSEFEGILRQTGVEQYQDLIHSGLPPLPFGFVFAPRLEKGSVSSSLYIVPPEVVERRDVPAWHFDLARWDHKPGGHAEYWFYVTRAEPWP
jgi:hypothetical protein